MEHGHRPERLTSIKKRARSGSAAQFAMDDNKLKRHPGRPIGSTKKAKSSQEDQTQPCAQPSSSQGRTSRLRASIQQGTHEKKASSKGRKKTAEGVFELSVTISIGGEDVDPALLSAVQKFLVENAISGKCSLERGGSAFHLHLQMVVRIVATSIIAVSKLIKSSIGWDVDKPPGENVMCRKLTNKGMHTFQGMLAYCMKDANKQHFATVDHNVMASDIQEGHELYALFGNEDNKNRVVLSLSNVVDKVYRWRQFNWDVEAMNVISKASFSTATRLEADEILLHTPNKKEKCSSPPMRLVGDGKPDNDNIAIDRKGKKKANDSPTRHLWPLEWNMDWSDSDSSSSTFNRHEPSFIPLCKKRYLGVHFS